MRIRMINKKNKKIQMRARINLKIKMRNLILL